LLLLLIEGGQSWPWASWETIVLAAVSVTALALFSLQETRAPEPALPLDLFKTRIILVSAVGAVFTGAILIGLTFEVPLYVQGVLGQDALHGGFDLAPMTIGWPIAAALSGKLAIRFGYRAVAVVGMVTNTVAAGAL